MARGSKVAAVGAAWLLSLGSTAAHAHHIANFAPPATLLDGLLSGLAHPVIGLDHLLFIVGAGIIAARFERGIWLPLVFVVASLFSAAVRYLGTDLSIGEMPVAASLVILGAMMLAAIEPGESVVALLFLAAGTLHGHSLAESIVGAERLPVAAYLVGLAVIQSLVAGAAWSVARGLAERRPQLPLQRLAGVAVGAAGLVFAGIAAL